jgi:hypothetical protein
VRHQLLMAAAVLMATAACNADLGTQATSIKVNPSIFQPRPPVETVKTYLPSAWTPTPDGRPENPTVSPNECDCGPGFTPSYNGHNWVCARGLDRELPAKNNFCNVEHPGR